MPNIQRTNINRLCFQDGVIESKSGGIKIPFSTAPTEEHQSILDKKNLMVELGWVKIVISDIPNVSQNLLLLEALNFYRRGILQSSGFRLYGCNIKTGFITDFPPKYQKIINECIDDVMVMIVLNDGDFFKLNDTVPIEKFTDWDYSKITGYFYKKTDSDVTIPFFQDLKDLKVKKIDIGDLPMKESVLIREMFKDSPLNPDFFNSIDWRTEFQKYPDVCCKSTSEYHIIVRFSDWTYKVYNFCNDGNYVCHKEFQSYNEARLYGEIRADIKLYGELIQSINLYKQLSSIETKSDKVSIETKSDKVSIGNILFEYTCTPDGWGLHLKFFKVVKVTYKNIYVKTWDYFNGEVLDLPEMAFVIHPQGKTFYDFMGVKRPAIQWVINLTTNVFMSDYNAKFDISKISDIAKLEELKLNLLAKYPFLQGLYNA